MELNDILANVADQDRGKEFELADPVTGTPTGIRFRVAVPTVAPRTARASSFPMNWPISTAG